MPRAARITIFKWGYEGWGNATKTLVRTVDAVERARGYDPPVFVDIRYRRAVRAIGFRDDAFEMLLGHSRYRWMRSLGNENIDSGDDGIRIHCPVAVHQLLDLAIDASADNRRLIFFCSCPSPHGAEYCHRTPVAALLLRAARRRRVGIEIQEWPGGTPVPTSLRRLRIEDAEMRKVRAGAKNVKVSSRQASVELAAAPWGSLFELAAGAERQLIAAGPPRYWARRWELPLFGDPAAMGATATSLMRDVRQRRARSKLERIRT